jgi:hypothetical protein
MPPINFFCLKEQAGCIYIVTFEQNIGCRAWFSPIEQHQDMVQLLRGPANVRLSEGGTCSGLDPGKIELKMETRIKKKATAKRAKFF